MAKPIDIPFIVEYGAADIGIVGSDVLRATKRAVIELLDLQTNRSIETTDRLIINRASYFLKNKQIDLLCTKLSAVLPHATSE